MQNTPNYGLKKPEQEDFYNVDDFNANTDMIDTELESLENNKLNKTGDASNVTNTFTQASTRANLVSGENQSTIFGKLMKWFADLKPVAWSGNASDLNEDANNRLVTDAEKTTWNNKLDTSGGIVTGDLTLTNPLTIKGSSTGDGNWDAFLEFQDSTGEVRGTVGDSGSDDNFNVASSVGDLMLMAPPGKKVQTKIGSVTHDFYHQGNDGVGSGLDADLFQGQGLDAMTYTKIIYDPYGGFLVDLGEFTNAIPEIYTIDITGSSHVGVLPVHTKLQFRHSAVETFSELGQLNLGYSLLPCKIMLHDGMMKVWVPIDQHYTTVNVSVWKRGLCVTEGIALSTSAEPMTLPLKEAKELGLEPQTVTGKVTFSMTNTVKGVKGFDSTYTYEAKEYNQVLSVSKDNFVHTGPVKITSPYSWTTALLNLEVDIATYSQAYSKVLLSGVDRNPETTWNSTKASVLGVTNFTRVRFGHDGTNCCILLGDETTQWQHPKISISKLFVGYIGASFDWSNDWQIDFITDETGIDVKAEAPIQRTVSQAELDELDKKSILNEIMIGYDDSIHDTTPLQDILKDLFDKSQALVGNDKPFELSFIIGTAEHYAPNLHNKIVFLINENYGNSITASQYFKFKIDSSTAAGINNEINTSGNKCSIWNGKYYFEWEFDYDNFENVIVRDAKGNSFLIEDYIEIGNGQGTNGGAGNSIILDESVWNFANISISTIQESETVNVIHKKIPVSDLTARQSSTTAYRNGSAGDSVFSSNFVSYLDVTGLTLAPSTSGLFVSYTRIADDGTSIRFTDGCGVFEVYGHNRIYPAGTTHSVEMIDNKLFKVVTMPNNEKIIKNLTSSIEKQFSVLVG